MKLCGSAQRLPSGATESGITLGPMSTTEALAYSDDPQLVRAAVEVVIPVFNEETDLEPNVRLLRRYLDTRFPLATVVTIADNASTDGTWVIAERLSQSLPGVRAVHLDEKGRGRAIKHVWRESDALVVAYMDVDLSTGLDALLPLVAPLLSGHAEMAIGTRLAPGARVERGHKRAFISRSYNLLLHASLGSSFSDAQCGFKAVRTDVAKSVLPLVEDNAWFFDTEMLMIADHSGLRIHEVAVDWTDDPDSRVKIIRTAVDDLRGVLRLMRAGIRRRRRVAFSRYRPGPVSALSGQMADGVVR